MAPHVRSRVSTNKDEAENGKKVVIARSVKVVEGQECEKHKRGDKGKHANTVLPVYPLKSPGRRRGQHSPLLSSAMLEVRCKL